MKTMKVCNEYIYLLKQKSRHHFKVGRTKTYNRIHQLSDVWGKFDLDSEIFVVGKNSKKVEKAVHASLKEHRKYIKTKNSRKKLLWKKDGYTEFFEISCYEQIRNELTEKYDVISMDELKSVTTKKPDTRIRLTEQEFRKKAKERQGIRQAKNWDYSKVDFSKAYYGREEHTFICKKHGLEFEETMRYHLNKQIHGCVQCHEEHEKRHERELEKIRKANIKYEKIRQKRAEELAKIMPRPLTKKEKESVLYPMLHDVFGDGVEIKKRYHSGGCSYGYDTAYIVTAFIPEYNIYLDLMGTRDYMDISIDSIEEKKCILRGDRNMTRREERILELSDINGFIRINDQKLLDNPKEYKDFLSNLKTHFYNEYVRISDIKRVLHKDANTMTFHKKENFYFFVVEDICSDGTVEKHILSTEVSRVIIASLIDDGFSEVVLDNLSSRV